MPLVKLILVVFALPLVVAACSPTGVVVGGAATAGTAALEERGLRQAALDLETKGLIVNQWFQHEAQWAADLTATVYDGRAMLTGTLNSEADRAEAIGLAWSVDGVKEVINEIKLQGSSVADFANDAWISTKLQTQMTFDQDIMAVNYKIEVVNGTIYMIGVAQSQEELNRVMTRAKSIESVRRVVSHVKIKSL